MAKSLDAHLVREIAGLLAQQPDVIGAYVFGSRASGEERPGSDLDLAVLFAPSPTLDRLVDLEGELAQALELAVQVIDVGRAKPFLALAAVEGERVYAPDGARLDEFDLYVLRRAGDLAPFERQRRAALLAPRDS